MTSVLEPANVKQGLEIWFEEVKEPQTFAHVRSFDGVLGHAAEVRARIPVGTWLTVQPEYQPTLTTFLTDRCGFRFMGCLVVGAEAHDLLQKVSD